MTRPHPGLTDDEVDKSRAAHGTNAIANQEAESFLDKLLGNLKDPIIIILIVALLITLVLAFFGYAEWYESLGIAFAVAIATLVATWSEHSNEQSFQKLLEEASLIQVKVFRRGQLTEVPIEQIVVGDCVLLQPGDTIPADGLLIDGDVEIDNAALTGESEPVMRTSLTSATEPAPASDDNRVFRAGLVIDGECVLQTTAVGERTRYGQTMKELISAEDRLSPLQHKLAVLGRHIALFGYIGAGFIFVAFVFNNIFLQGSGLEAYFAKESGVIVHDFLTAAILAIIVIVVAVPEGLPMMIAMVLAINMKKLLAVKVLVRKLLGIETAGSLNILFSDKTGTLTQGRLVVSSFLDGAAKTFDRLGDIPRPLRDEVGFALRNNTSLFIDASNPRDIKTVGGDRTERALLDFITPYLAQDEGIGVVERIPFNSTRKFSATQVSGKRPLTLVKGAPSIVLPSCRRFVDENGDLQPLRDLAAVQAGVSLLAGRAMRVLAVAVTESPLGDSKALPGDLILVGVAGMRDELRDNAPASIETAKSAGIHVVMITGDAKETAQAIARDVGLLEDDPKALVLTSSDLSSMSDEELKKALPHLRVVARTFPTDKSRLVKLAKELGLVVGMTGDGVNDAPAVKNADVGFAMGSGTEMTKESSDIVILDDNFGSLTKAVLYGRTLFKSIRKFLVFQLTVSVSAILVVFCGQFFGFDLPLTMTQLLWLNIIMDTLAGLAFAGEAALPRYMQDKPLKRDERLISPDMWSSILVNGPLIATCSILFLTNPITRDLFDGGQPSGPAADAKFLTGFFAFFVFSHVFNTLNARTEGLNLFEHLLDNRLFMIVIPSIMAIQVLFITFGGKVLRTVGLTPNEWAYALLFASIVIPVDLLRKMVRNMLFGNPVATAARCDPRVPG